MALTPFGQRVTAILHQQNKRVKWLVGETKLDPSTLSKYLNGHRNPPPWKAVNAICRALNLSVPESDELFISAGFVYEDDQGSVPVEKNSELFFEFRFGVGAYAEIITRRPCLASLYAIAMFGLVSSSDRKRLAKEEAIQVCNQLNELAVKADVELQRLGINL